MATFQSRGLLRTMAADAALAPAPVRPGASAVGLLQPGSVLLRTRYDAVGLGPVRDPPAGRHDPARGPTARRPGDRVCEFLPEVSAPPRHRRDDVQDPLAAHPRGEPGAALSRWLRTSPRAKPARPGPRV